MVSSHSTPVSQCPILSTVVHHNRIWEVISHKPDGITLVILNGQESVKIPGDTEVIPL